MQYLWIIVRIQSPAPSWHNDQEGRRQTGRPFAFPSSWREQDALLFFIIYVSARPFGGMVARAGLKNILIIWLCRDNRSKEQTRKWLHFIKDPAGEQQSDRKSPPHLCISPPSCFFHYTRNSPCPSPVSISSVNGKHKSIFFFYTTNVKFLYWNYLTQCNQHSCLVFLFYLKMSSNFY